MNIGTSLFLATVCLSVISGSLNVFHRKEIDKNIINGYVLRTIDLSSQLVKINSTIHMHNSGESSILGFLFAIDSKYHEQLSFISAYSEKYVKYKLKIDDVLIEEHQDTAFKYITFAEALLPGNIVNVHIETIFLHRLQPYPKYIKESDPQLVQFYDRYFFYSPYFTIVQRTKVILPSKNVYKFTKYEPFTISGNICKLGPYYNISEFSSRMMMFRYENNNPLLTVRRLQRVIIMSHWGIIHVEDTLRFENKGAIDSLQKERQYPAKSMYPITTTLPKEARNIRYYDKMGNIYTSKINYHNTSILLELWPRVSGEPWTEYSISYVLPTQEFLYHSDGDFVLKMKFIDNLFSNMCIQEAEMKIVLPEGASEVMFFVPFATFRLPNTFTNVFLDFMGRQTISVLARNLVDKHVVDFELLYDTQSISMFQKPVILVLIFFLTFIVFILFHRRICCKREKSD